MSHMKRLLLWDIDGTLLRNKGAGKRAMNRAFAELFGKEDAFEGAEMAGMLDLRIIGGVFATHGIDLSRMDEYLQAYYPALEDEMRDPALTQLMPGIVEALERTQEETGFYNALGTGNLERGARIKLDTYGLNGYFPVGGFCEGPTERWEVLAQGVKKATEHYGVEFAPSEVIVIGDTWKDILAARKIGARAVAVATGGDTLMSLEMHCPDLLLRDMTEQERFFQFCRDER
jgi:phosphoglycolate phosphatase